MRMQLRLSFLALLALLTVVVLLATSGCGQKPPATGPTTGPAPGPSSAATPPAANPNEEYVMIGISTGVEYWNANKQGLMDVCQELGVKGTFTGPQDQNPEQQANVMDQIIARKPAGILIAPGNPKTLKSYINKAVEAGIPVICVDTDAPDSNRIAYFGTSNFEAGVTGARTLCKGILALHKADKPTGGKWKVAISSRPGQWNLDERVRGYKETIAKEFPQVEVVQVVDDETKYSVGEQKCSAVIAAHPDIAGFAGCNAASGPGIAAAVAAAGKVGKIVIVAMDADSAILDKIESGVITASVAQRQYYMTYIGVKYLYGLVHGDFRKPGDATKATLPEVPKVIDTGTVEVNKDNVKVFRTPSQGAKEELAAKHPDWLKLLSDRAAKPAGK
jgi:ribose transport system substrate-binding protein